MSAQIALTPEIANEIKSVFAKPQSNSIGENILTPENEIKQAFGISSPPQRSSSKQDNFKGVKDAAISGARSGGVQTIEPEKIGKAYEDVAVRPGAAIRSFLQGKGYAEGAINPDKVPYFQDIALNNYYKSTDDIIRKVQNPTIQNIVRSVRDTAGLGISTVGYIADMATNPFDLLTEIASVGISKVVKGVIPQNKNTVIQIIRNSDDLKRDQKFMDTVVDGFSKAIRPTKTGKGTYTRLAKFNANSALAVDSILENSDGLKYLDKAGNIVNQGKPQSLGELSQAIEQTKNALYRQYTTLEKASGKRGTIIKLDGIVDELLNSISGREANIFKEDAEKVMSLAQRFDELKYLNLDEADNTLKMLNEDLKAYYRGTSTSGIPRQKALAAKMLRDEMDNAITKSGIAQSHEYRDLRRRYGALKELEKDVAGRFIVAGRQNPKGFFDLTDVFSGGLIAEGILTAKKATTAKGLVMYGIKKGIKALNNPDRLIAHTFSVAEKIKYSKPLRIPVKLTEKTAATVGTIRQSAEKLLN